MLNLKSNKLFSIFFRFKISFGVIILAVVALYMGVWLKMPLYPDEIAYRVGKARLTYDHGIQYGFYPSCLSSIIPISIFFYPAAYFYEILDNLPLFISARIIPYISLIICLCFYVKIISNQRWPGAASLILLGFLGVSGSGLILSRPEGILLIQPAICLFAYIFLCIKPVNAILRYLIILVLIFLSSLTFYIHMESLIFLPITLLPLLIYLAKKNNLYDRSIGVLSVILILIMGGYGLIQNIKINWSCKEESGISNYLSSMTLTHLLTNDSIFEIFKYKAFWFSDYIEKFLFEKVYTIGYLPGVIPITGWNNYLVHVLNITISVLLIANITLAIAITFYGGFKFFTGLTKRYQEKDSSLLSLNPSEYLFLFLTGLGLFALLLDDMSAAFYRAFFLNLELALLNSLALSFLNLKRTDVFKWVGVVLFPVILCGTFSSFWFFSPFFSAKNVGPNINIMIDWSKIKKRVETLEYLIGVKDSSSRIIVDDMTYEALKKHADVLPITYLGLSAMLSGAKGPTQVRDFIMNIHPTAFVVRCSSLDGTGFIPQFRDDGLCAAKLPLH